MAIILHLSNECVIVGGYLMLTTVIQAYSTLLK